MLHEAIYPLKNLQEFFGLIFLYLESDDDLKFVSNSFNDCFDTNYNDGDIELLLIKYLRLLKLNETGLQEIFNKLKNKVNNKKQLIMPPVNRCLECKLLLSISSEKNEITAYCFDKPKIMLQMNKRCHRCSIEYSFRNYTKFNSSFEYLYSSKISSDFLATSRETCFEIKLLKYFDEQIILQFVLGYFILKTIESRLGSF